MTLRCTRHLLLGSSGALALAMFAQPAAAQSTAPPIDDEADVAVATDEGNVIVVTARRREERLQDVPIAVTALSGDQLEARGAIDITDVALTTPSVTLEASRGTNSTLTAFIRGVGQQDPVAGFEAGVGIYLDDVYLNRPQAAVLEIYDVERIEVLRGPQGTLYGRNTIGGAIKYVTKRLGDDPRLSLRATYGTYDQADLTASFAMPIGDSGLAIGGGGAVLTREGFGTNLTTGEENYDKAILAARGSIEYDRGAVFVRLSGDYTDDNSNPRGGHRLIPGLQSGTPVLDDVFDTRGGLNDPKQDVEAYGGSLFVEVEAGDAVTLRSITGYRKDDSGTPIDFDALPAVDVDVPAFYNNEQFSQEVQALVDLGRFNGLVGFYYLDANARTVFDVRLPGTVTALTFGDVDTETYAVFGDATFEITPQISISGGARYTWDTRRSDILRQVFVGGGSPFFGGPGVLFQTTSNFEGERDFEEFTPRVSLSFQPTRDHLFYASYSKGFKGGGFDPRGVTTAAPDQNGDGTISDAEVFEFITFDPETVDAYEIGYKGSLLDNRLNLSLAAFRSDYTDVQIPGSVGAVVNGQQTFIGVTTNAGEARIQGIEAEGSAILAEDFAGPTSNLVLSGMVSYLDAEYRQFIDARGIDVADRRAFQNTPEWAASGTISTNLPLGSGYVNINGTASYRSRTQQFELRNPLLDQEGFTLFQASVVWHVPGDRFSLGLHGRNLTDEEYIVSGYSFLAQNPDTGEFLRNADGGFVPTLGSEGVLTAYYGNPRQVFVTATLDF
ncbi:TonB-dependent receptor [Erythrobacter litoralis]|uniref:TonB-dependent receptor n=1 Tax=Erythrobacter litoralis TaxID=39960 RepID=UPI002435ACFB|nr:TonB-dependent receptor [Erythrobacter litoralis]MDG6078054.1 TonB-dependent receptor [Erythrobacter litoralis]